MSAEPPDRTSPRRRRPAPWRALPGAIWAMGFGSLFMDVSSEMIHGLLPLFLVTTLGASIATVGLVEGVAEATASAVKVFSGALSDRLRKRKLPMLFGYALAALTKPIFPLATSIGWVSTARFVDRIGKGIRGAPRDALVADLAPVELRGAAFGLRQALDSVGALLGPLLAVVCMAWLGDDVRAVLWIAVAPAFVAVAVLAFGVREPASAAPGPAPARLALAGIRRLPPRYWLVVAAGAVLTLARFSEAFLVLRAADAGFPLGRVPLVLVAMNLFYAAASYPAGAAADRASPRALLGVGLALLVAADLVLALGRGPIAVLSGAALWGLHLAFTQGLLSKRVADTVPAELRGTAFGLFHLVGGGALLAASVIAGALWSALGPAATFLAGAGFAAVAALGLVLPRGKGAPLQRDGA